MKMNDFFLITKINLLDFLNIRKITNFKYKKERQRNIIRISLFLIMIVLLFFFIYRNVSKLLPDFINLNKERYVLGISFIFVNIFIFIYNLFKVKGSLFNFKDYPLLSSFPIKRSVIIASKLFSMYLFNLGLTLLFMLPVFLAYQEHLTFSNLNYLTTLLIPIIPLCFSIIIGIILSLTISRFKSYNILSYCFTSVLLFGILLLLFNTTKKISLQMPYFVFDIVDNFQKYFFFLINFLALISDFSLKNVGFFILYPLLISSITILFVDKYYFVIRNIIIQDKIEYDYNLKNYPKKSVLASLYQKEFRRITSNSLYIINSLFGCILIILIILFSTLFGSIMHYFDLNNLKYSIIIFVSFLCMISSTTHASISLEGKSLWIMKMLPISEKDILWIKILVNLTFLLPTILLSFIFFGIYLKMRILELLLLFFMPLMYAFLTSFLGLLLNLIYPRFSYQNDLKVLTQSTPVYFNFFFGGLLLLFPLVFVKLDLIYVVVNSIIVLVINILLAITLYYYGCKRFKAL